MLLSKTQTTHTRYINDEENRADTNSANTRVLVKDFGIRIAKLVLEYSLRSHNPAHMMFLAPVSDTISIISCQERGQEHNISVVVQCVCHCCYFKKL